MFFARYLDNFVHCCYASAAVPGLQCVSPGNEFSSCDDLMKNWALRACLWVLGISATLGNIAVIILRTILEKGRRGTMQGRERRGTRPGQERRVQPFLLINLAVSDFLMGIYLLIIAIKDAQWQGEYFKHDFDWRAGSVCQLAGALSRLSSEVSVLKLISYIGTFRQSGYHFRVLCLKQGIQFHIFVSQTRSSTRLFSFSPPSVA